MSQSAREVHGNGQWQRGVAVVQACDVTALQARDVITFQARSTTTLQACDATRIVACNGASDINCGAIEAAAHDVASVVSSRRSGVTVHVTTLWCCRSHCGNVVFTSRQAVACVTMGYNSCHDGIRTHNNDGR
jgi:hypothetical protein